MSNNFPTGKDRLDAKILFLIEYTETHSATLKVRRSTRDNSTMFVASVDHPLLDEIRGVGLSPVEAIEDLYYDASTLNANRRLP